MSSPAKKRKLNSDGKQKKPTSTKGLEYFFAKQRQNGSTSKTSSTQEVVAQSSNVDDPLTDEELARKLQAEWDAEVGHESSSHSTLTPVQPEERSADTPVSGAIPPSTPQQPPMSPSPPRSQAMKTTTTLSLSSVAASGDEITATIPLDESPLVFEPSKYIPQLQQSWSSDGGNASYALLTRCFVLVNGTQSRIKIVDTLVNCIRLLIEGDAQSLLPAVWLSTNAISPPYISMELGLGGSAISKALKQACGLDSRALKALYNKVGDPGDVAFEAKKKQTFTLRKPKPLTVKGVFASLVKISKAQGPGSGDAKQRIVDRLLQDARGGEESRYIVRTLCQHLRIGAVKTTMLIALSRAFLLSKPPGANFATRDPQELAKLKKEDLADVWARSEELVKASYARHPDYNDLIPVLLDTGISEELLVRCGLTMHIPLRPMLGSITRDLSEMLTKLQDREFACEYKYDGQRAQVHCDANGKVSIFSRHLEFMTDKYPDLVALVPKIRGDGVESFILEGEVVAVDRATGELKNFQTLTNRARKDVTIGAVTIDVCLFAFDLMYLNGQSLLDQPFRRRRDLLRSLFVEIPHHFTWVKSLDATSQDSEAVLEFFKSALETKCEGIMVKILDNLPDNNGHDDNTPEPTAKPIPKKTRKAKETATADRDTALPKPSRRKPLLATYEPDKRLDSWLKVKKDYSATSDTLDLIPIAAWHGQGRKARWWSPILLAVRNDETGCLEAVCKCMSGFTDLFYKANRAFYDEGSGDGERQAQQEEDDLEDGNGGPDEDQSRVRKNTHAKKPGFIEYEGGIPDVWFEPQEVWEVAFADITVSPTYTAAIGLAREDRGLSLRFPRFLRKREDKGVEEASTSAFLAGLWRKQEAKAPTREDKVLEDDQEEEEGALE